MSSVVEISTPAQLVAVCELLELMYPKLAAQKVARQVGEMRQEGWKFIGIFDGQRCDAVVMYYVGVRLFSGKFLQPESLFVRPQARGKGYARALFEWMEKKAEEQECDRIFLHSFVESSNAHKFFFKQGYHIRGFAINKLLNDNYES